MARHMTRLCLIVVLGVLSRVLEHIQPQPLGQACGAMGAVCKC